MNELQISNARGNESVGQCILNGVTMSQQQLITSLEAETGGFTWPTYSEILEYVALMKETPMEDKPPMNLFASEHHIHAMILGTLLGDGSIPNPEIHHYCKKLATSHGEDQKEYAAAKMLMLSELRPTWYITQSKGYTKENNIFHFATTTSAALDPYWSLCYSKPEVLPDGRVKMRKYVSQAWVDQLTWEAVAWWIQDDGSLSGKCYNIATHSFSEEEVKRLVAWFRKHGLSKQGEVEMTLVTLNNAEKKYPIIRFSTAASRKVAEKIAPYMHPSMAYKLEVESPFQVCVCQDCGVEFRATRQKLGVMQYYNAIRCPGCVKKARKASKDQYKERVGMEEMRRRWREEKRATAEKGRKYSREYYRRNKDAILKKAKLKRSGSFMKGS